MQNYCLQANIEKQEKGIISFKNFLFFFNEGKLEIRRSGRFSRVKVITYTTSMRKRLRNEKKGILVDISNMEV